MTSKRHLRGIACLVISLLFSHNSSAELSLEDLETQLDFTIRSACHGYMIDAIPDFLSDARVWLNRQTPFCQTVRSLPDSESSADLLRQEKNRTKGVVPEVDSVSPNPSSQPEFTSRMQEYYAKQQGVDIECQDWMCQHIRMKVWEEGNPIGLTDYQKVAAHCDRSYGCIESWFSTWPRELPSQTVSLSLDALLEAQSFTQQPPANSAAIQVSPGLSLDALLEAEQQPRKQLGSLDETATTGTGANGNELSLDNIFAGREQLVLGKSQRKIDELNQRLSALCECSLRNAGCFKLPSESLLQEANQQEESRYQQCNQWQQLKKVVATSSQQASEQILALTELNTQVASIDHGMTATVDSWKEQQRRLIAQQQYEEQQRSDSAFMAGMFSIIAQTGAVANGSISAEQAAQNALNVIENVENGGGQVESMAQSITSAVPSYSSNTASGSAGGSSAGGDFSCFDTGSQICVDYRIFNDQKAQQMKNQCRQGGNRLLASCDVRGASCSMSSSIGSQTTFSYGSSVAQVKQICVANGGRFRSN